MGCCVPVAPPEELSQRKRHKVLFLGPGGSGKSTLFKQLRHLYGKGFVMRDKADAKCGIASFVIETMKNLLNNPLFNKDQLSSMEAIQAATNIAQIRKTDGLQLTHPISNAIKILWNEPQIKEIFEIAVSVVIHAYTHKTVCISN